MPCAGCSLTGRTCCSSTRPNRPSASAARPTGSSVRTTTSAHASTLPTASWRRSSRSGSTRSTARARRARSPRRCSTSFDSVPEQDEAKRLLRAALNEGPAHAYLFHGPAGVGKRAAAVAFASELLGNDPRVGRRSHPDLYVLSTYRSGCERRPTRGSLPSSSEANATAAARLPTPAGPWKRYACAGPSFRAARRSRFASSCSGTLSKLVEHLLGDLARRARAVDRVDPLREDLRQLAVGSVDACAEVVVLTLDPVGRAADALGRFGRVDEQQVRPVREQPAHRVQIQLEHSVEAEAARDALVGEGRVEVAVADDVRAAVERGHDHLVHELRAGGGEECRLGPGCDMAGMEEQLAHLLAELGAAWLPRGDDVAALAGERLGQKLHLRRLAGAVDSLKGHEH